MDLEMVEFKLDDVLIASISQIMIKSNGKGIMIVDNLDKKISAETLYGDGLRLQQVLADFLLISVNFTPSGGQLGVAANLTKDSLGESVQLAHLVFRYEPNMNLQYFLEVILDYISFLECLIFHSTNAVCNIHHI